VIVAFPVALLQTRSNAQPGAKPTVIGLLDASDRQEWWEAFRQQLRELGYIEGRNVSFETRLAKGDLELLPAMARELVRLKVNVIVTSGTSAALAAKRASSTIPVVMATGTDQVSLGLAASLARPAGNVTGLSTQTSELMGKRFDLVHELVPNISRLAVLWHNDNLSSMASVRDLEMVAARSRVALQTVGVRNAEELGDAFSSMTRERAEAVIVVQTPLMYTERNEITKLATKHRLPSMYGATEYVVAGGLMSYAPSYPELFRHAAVYTQKILKGANPGDLPIEQPTTFELVINANTARALGIAVPPSMLARASRVIR
jgi:putative tryptophan/tyrosine transport system substrate-binding protein